MADKDEQSGRRRRRRRNLITTLILALIALGFYMGIVWRWSNHPPVTQQSTSEAAAHMGRY